VVIVNCPDKSIFILKPSPRGVNERSSNKTIPKRILE